MAITPQITGTKMVMSYNYGTVDGKEKIAGKTYSNIKTDATDQQVYDLAHAIDKITVPTLEDVSRQVNTLLISA